MDPEHQVRLDPTPPDHREPEELYRQALDSFDRGAWQEAVDALTALQATGHLQPEAEDLLADARLKLQWVEVERPIAKPPPRRRSKVMIVIAVCFVALDLWLVPRLIGPPMTRLFNQAPVVPTPSPSAAPTSVPTPSPVAPAVQLPVEPGIASTLLGFADDNYSATAVPVTTPLKDRRAALVGTSFTQGTLGH